MADSIFKRAGQALGISKAVSTQTLGTTRSAGNVITGEGAGTFDDPDRTLNLVGQRRYEEYDRMVRDVAIVGAGVRLLLNLISNAVWTVNGPADLDDAQKAEADGYAKQAYAAIFGMTSSWSSVVRKTAGFRFYGFSVQEWTAKKMIDGSIGLLDIEHRPQRTITRWVRDEGGTVDAVVQRVPGRNDVTLPRSKIVYAVDDTLTDSPEGVGLFRHLAKTTARLELFLMLEEIGFTTDLRGIPIARAPLAELRQEVLDAGPDGSEARAEAEERRNGLLQPFRDFLNKHVRNEKTGAMIPSDTFLAVSADKASTPSAVPKWALELLNGDSQSFDAMAAAVNRMNQELARVLGVEHILLGAEGNGSHALAKSKVGTFYLTVTSTLLDLLEIYDRDILDPLSELNGWPEELWPEMGVNEISDRDLAEVVTALKDLATAGAPLQPNDPAVGEIYDLLGLERPPERDESMDLALTGTMAPHPAPPGTPAAPSPGDPKAELQNSPEDQVNKQRRVMRSRRKMAKRAARRSA